MISKEVSLVANENEHVYTSNPFYVKLSDVLFVLSWLFTVIYNDETMARSLQRYLTIKYFMLLKQWGL